MPCYLRVVGRACLHRYLPPRTCHHHATARRWCPYRLPIEYLHRALPRLLPHALLCRWLPLPHYGACLPLGIPGYRAARLPVLPPRAAGSAGCGAACRLPIARLRYAVALPAVALPASCTILPRLDDWLFIAAPRVATTTCCCCLPTCRCRADAGCRCACRALPHVDLIGLRTILQVGADAHATCVALRCRYRVAIDAMPACRARVTALLPLPRFCHHPFWTTCR